MTLTKAMAESAEMKEFVESTEEASEIMDMAFKLEGIVRNVGRHAGGVVIAPSALTDFVPLYTEESGTGLVSQFDKDDVERAGLVKFDFLGLKTLTIIDWAVKSVNKYRQTLGEEPVEIESIPLDDRGTFEQLRRRRYHRYIPAGIAGHEGFDPPPVAREHRRYYCSSGTVSPRAIGVRCGR